MRCGAVLGVLIGSVSSAASARSAPSDAYATGQAVYALTESGGAPSGDAAVTRGAQLLLSTQQADGSWFVQSRAIPLQPLFESGFPHGCNQWISAAAINWARTGAGKYRQENCVKRFRVEDLW